MTTTSEKTSPLPIVLFVFGIFILLSVGAAAFWPGTSSFVLAVLSIPGHFLTTTFHLASLFVPAYFLVAGFHSTRKPFPWRRFGYLQLLILPFLFWAVALRLFAAGSNPVDLAGAPLLEWVATHFSRVGGALLSATLGVVVAVTPLLISRRRSATLLALPAPVAADQSADKGPSGEAGAGEPSPEKQATEDPVGFLELLPEEPRDDAEEWVDALEEQLEEELEEPDSAALELDFSYVEDPADEEPLVVRFRQGRFFSDSDVDDSFEDAPSPPEPRPRSSRRRGYNVPIDGILSDYGASPYWEIDDETRHAAEVLRITLEEFQIQAEVTGIRKGPVITMFEILPAPGVKLAKITNLADNIALRLAASSVRIVAPIPGKHAVGIEIPNKTRHIVAFGELVREKSFTKSTAGIPLALGKEIPGDSRMVDLTKMPHLLIAGATGSGKSVCVNSIICSILYRCTPEQVKMILIDPKIVELKFYNDIPHLLTPVITDPKRAFQAIQYCIYEMERRYNLLDALGVRDIRSYNAKIERERMATEALPYLVVVVDEFADLMATSGKELETTLARLAAMSRAVGIHLVLATQRPSTDVITGLIKANIPSRIAFMVSSKVDSRIIIDTVGAEKLLGQGDMLIISATDPFPLRLQGAFLSEEEVERIVAHVRTLGEPDYIDEEIFDLDEDDPDLQGELEDPLMEEAIEVVVASRKASASYLQRRLKVGYNRAARMVEEMERLGIVGPQNGSKPREVIGHSGGV
jgi:DNA segregation ATPase FtsK/SpoIIIE, S-DNA-T family